MFALHVLKSLSLSLPDSHTLGPCAATTSRAAAESIRARGGENVEEEREGEAEGKWREIEREETVKITGRINTEHEA